MYSCRTTEIHKELQNAFSILVKTKILNLVKAVIFYATFSFAFRKTYGGVSAREIFFDNDKIHDIYFENRKHFAMVQTYVICQAVLSQIKT